MDAPTFSRNTAVFKDDELKTPERNHEKKAGHFSVNKSELTPNNSVLKSGKSDTQLFASDLVLPSNSA